MVTEPHNFGAQLAQEPRPLLRVFGEDGLEVHIADMRGRVAITLFAIMRDSDEIVQMTDGFFVGQNGFQC
jgi:hypothetical protein